MLRRPPWHSDLGLKCIDKGAALQGKETSCWDQHPEHIHMDKHTHRSTWKWRQSASEILHPTWGQVAGLCVVEDPVLPGSLRTHRVSQWMSTAAKRSIPEKGPVWAATALPFSSSISEVPSCLPGLSGRLQRTGDRDAVVSLDGVSEAIRHDCQHISGKGRQTVRNTRSPSRDTPWVQDSGHKLHHLNMCQCPATKLCSCWGWSCRRKQYIMTSYKRGKKNLFPLFLRKCKIKPIIFNPRQLTNLKFSPIGKKITAWLGFISFSFFPTFSSYIC